MLAKTVHDQFEQVPAAVLVLPKPFDRVFSVSFRRFVSADSKILFEIYPQILDLRSARNMRTDKAHWSAHSDGCDVTVFWLRLALAAPGTMRRQRVRSQDCCRKHGLRDADQRSLSHQASPLSKHDFRSVQIDEKRSIASCHNRTSTTKVTYLKIFLRHMYASSMTHWLQIYGTALIIMRHFCLLYAAT